MARPPKPWYWKARQGWYVTINGERHFLSEDKKQASLRFHELMAKPKRQVIASNSVVAIIDLFLGWTEKNRKPDTYQWYLQRLQAFATHIGSRLKVSSLKPYHVQQFIDGMTCASGTKRNYVRAAKRALKWAKQQGYIDSNPIEDLEKPKAGKRELVVSDAQFAELLSYVRDETFKELLLTTYHTGCRPQESLRLEARHVDLANSRWVFPETEEKNQTLYRVIYLSDEALEITKRLVKRYPMGKLFRNRNGSPWTTDAVNCAFVRIQRRMGMARGAEVTDQEIKQFATTLKPKATIRGVVREKRPAELRHEAKEKLLYRKANQIAPKYSLYTLRHSWSTHAMERGVDPLTVAILMGHQDPSTMAKVYQHVALNPVHMLEQAKKAAG